MAEIEPKHLTMREATLCDLLSFYQYR